MNTPASAITVVLTPREIAVLRHLASGCTYKQIALRLGVSLHTVVTHIKNAYRKLEAHNGAGAVMRAIQCGLFSLESDAPPMQAGAVARNSLIGN